MYTVNIYHLYSCVPNVLTLLASTSCC